MVRVKRLEDNMYNVMYVAAYLKYFIDTWKPFYNEIEVRTDILATLYNVGHETTTPHNSPESNQFGEYAYEYYDMMYILLQG